MSAALLFIVSPHELPDLFVEQPELRHALGHLDDFLVGPGRVETPHLRQQLLDERTQSLCTHAGSRIVQRFHD